MIGEVHHSSPEVHVMTFLLMDFIQSSYYDTSKLSWVNSIQIYPIQSRDNMFPTCGTTVHDWIKFCQRVFWVFSLFSGLLTWKQPGSTSGWNRRLQRGAPVRWGKQGWQKQWLQLPRDRVEWSEWETLVLGECAVERERKSHTLAHIRQIPHLINTIMLATAARRSQVCVETQGSSQ